MSVSPRVALAVIRGRVRAVGFLQTLQGKLRFGFLNFELSGLNLSRDVFETESLFRLILRFCLSPSGSRAGCGRSKQLPSNPCRRLDSPSSVSVR